VLTQIERCVTRRRTWLTNPQPLQHHGLTEAPVTRRPLQRSLFTYNEGVIASWTVKGTSEVWDKHCCRAASQALCLGCKQSSCLHLRYNR
jgi:hypothetical protein